MAVQVGFGLLQQRLLDLREDRGDRLGQPVERHGPLAAAHPRDEDGLPLGQIARPQLDAQRDPPHLPVVELPAGGHLRPIVQPDPDRGREP